jgi:hypothetical protein
MLFLAQELLDVCGRSSLVLSSRVVVVVVVVGGGWDLNLKRKALPTMLLLTHESWQHLILPNEAEDFFYQF